MVISAFNAATNSNKETEKRLVELNERPVILKQ